MASVTHLLYLDYDLSSDYLSQTLKPVSILSPSYEELSSSENANNGEP